MELQAEAERRKRAQVDLRPHLMGVPHFLLDMATCPAILTQCLLIAVVAGCLRPDVQVSGGGEKRRAKSIPPCTGDAWW